MIPFSKMHGLGNDFIVVDEWDSRVPKGFFTPTRARQWCDRRFGIGADQILIVGPARETSVDSKMEIWNADGSQAEMCGNGIRAVALYLHDHAPEGLRGKASYRIHTGAGDLEVFVAGRSVRVNMGPPRFLADAFEGIETPIGRLQFWEVNMGNPHAVFFLPPQESLQNLPLEQIGPSIENHSRFPKRTNIEFVRLKAPGELEVRVWERGAGMTLACGTGACASAVAALHSGFVAPLGSGHIKVELPGGSLELAWDGKKNGPVWMTGPAVEVFRGLY